MLAAIVLLAGIVVGPEQPAPRAAGQRQSLPAIASAAEVTYVGWSEDSRCAIARYADGAFEPEVTYVAGSQIALTADGPSAAVVSVASTVLGHLIEADGTMSASVNLGDSAGGPVFVWAAGAARVGETYVAIWSRNTPTQPGGFTRVTHVHGGAFDRSSGQMFVAGGHAEAVVSNGGTAIVAYVDANLVAWLAEIDRRRVVLSRVRLGEEVYSDVALASDGNGRVLAAWRGRIVAVDPARMTVVRSSSLPFATQPHLAWDGTTFLIATDDLELALLTRDGDVGAGILRIETPGPARNVRLGGNAIVYTRDDQVILRAISVTPRRRERPVRPR